jgi:hypothetical protein
MGKRHLIVLCLLWAALAYAQTDRGTLTGTVTDPSGGMIPAAKVVLTNLDTGLTYETVTTATGNYTLPSLVAGTYRLTVEQAGFSRYEQTGIRIQVAVTTRLDVQLKVGQVSESVVVTAEAAMLKTENAEQSSTISGDTINALPLNFGIGAGAIRNPLSFVQLTPGSTISGWNTIRVNGNPAGTYRILFEGQDSTSALDVRVSDEAQPSVEAIQEFTLQTSNFAAEFGQVAGGLFNFTSRSGTNEFHGSAYDIIVNEALNAGIPFTDNGKGQHVRPSKKLHDGGFSVGGPVWIPKAYNGRNRTFFFFNYEKYRDRQNAYLGLTTVPTDAFRSGNLSSMLTGQNLGTDFLGRAILRNQIYDPGTTRADSTGRLIRDPFVNNQIPASRFDAVTSKILGTMPKPNHGTGIVNNYELRTPFRKIQQIPSLKIDHTLPNSAKLSVYWSEQITDKDVGQDGLPDPVSQRRDLYIKSHTIRFNYDQSLTPTLLLHLGAGFVRYRNPDSSPAVIANYDAAGQLGLKGAPGPGYPRIGALGDDTWGGMSHAIGPTNRGLYLQVKPTGVTQLTYVRGNHTYKAGGEWRIDAFTNRSNIGLSPSLGFSSGVTAQPLYGQTLPGGTGIGYSFATFLLGLYDSGSIGNSTDPQYRKSAWAFYVQDTWKINRRLTFDYGIRYDLQIPMRELWHRTSTFAPDIPNPNANGILGAVKYEGSGPGRCNCNLVDTYPYAIAPRLGLAYQINPRTVFRAGWGFSYSFANNFAYIGGGNSLGMGFNTVNFTAPQANVEIGKLQDGLKWNPADLYGASYDPGLRVVPGQSVQSSPSRIDPNGGRPPRVNQWNISLQREITRNLVLEGAYVGNRGVWFNNSSLINYNAINPAYYTALGIDITKAADRTLLTGRIDSSNAVSRGFKKPYANYPDSGTVVQALKPYPQYSSIGATWAPLGATWYDAFQMKATKRYSYGLDFSVSYAFAKNLTNYDGNGNIFDRRTFKSLASSDLPHILTVSINYRLEAFGFMKRSRLTRMLLADWTLGSVLQYTSGALLSAPSSNNGLSSVLPGLSTRQFRVAGQPLYLKDLNGTIDPLHETVLNPAAWVDQPTGTWGTFARYYSDFRGQRRPSESMSFGKRFPLRSEGGRMALSVRVEFFNVFNRMVSLPDPSTSAPQTAPTRDANGVLTGGFGFINYTQISTNNQNNTYPAPRTGQFHLRFEF